MVKKHFGKIKLKTVLGGGNNSDYGGGGFVKNKPTIKTDVNNSI